MHDTVKIYIATSIIITQYKPSYQPHVLPDLQKGSYMWLILQLQRGITSLKRKLLREFSVMEIP